MSVYSLLPNLDAVFKIMEGEASVMVKSERRMKINSASVGFGFALFVPEVIFSPIVLFLTATVSLPVALTVGGMMFAASLIAVLRAGRGSSNFSPPSQ